MPTRPRCKTSQKVYVEINDDADLCHAFLHWTLNEAIYSQRGFGSGGQGHHRGFYDAIHTKKINDFFRKYKKEHPRAKAEN